MIFVPPGGALGWPKSRISLPPSKFVAPVKEQEFDRINEPFPVLLKPKP
jgi:hypothetical protein